MAAMRTALAAVCALAPLHAADPATAATDFQVYPGTQVPPEVERVYERGLKFLVASQNADASLPGQYGSERTGRTSCAETSTS